MGFSLHIDLNAASREMTRVVASKRLARAPQSLLDIFVMFRATTKA